MEAGGSPFPVRRQNVKKGRPKARILTCQGPEAAEGAEAGTVVVAFAIGSYCMLDLWGYNWLPMCQLLPGA